MPLGKNKAESDFLRRAAALFFSYHKIGLLVLFVHDITDIWLELTKVLHYLSMRANGTQSLFWESAATGSFIIFTFCWYGDDENFTSSPLPLLSGFSFGCTGIHWKFYTPRVLSSPIAPTRRVVASTDSSTVCSGFSSAWIFIGSSYVKKYRRFLILPSSSF